MNESIDIHSKNKGRSDNLKNKMIFGRKLFRFLFKLFCTIGLAFMIGYWLYKFVIEDRDVGVVDYELMEKAKDVEYPIPAFCFKDPFIEKNLKSYGSSINREAYIRYLKGELYNDELAKVDYENVTLNLDDHFSLAEVRLSNGSRADLRSTQLKHKNIFNGIFNNGEFFKCYAPKLSKDIIENAQEVGFLYRKHSLLDDVQSTTGLPRGTPYYVEVSIHYPGQFLLDTSKTIQDTLKQFNSKRIVVDISSIEILKRRKKRRHECFENWRSFDEMVLDKHITAIGCRAPYHLSDSDYPICKNEEDLRRSRYKFDEVRMKYYPKACWRMSKLDYSRLRFLVTRDRYWQFTVQYPEDVKIVTQSKEVDEHALVGNIGGYIGLFLGYALIQLPDLFFWIHQSMKRRFGVKSQENKIQANKVDNLSQGVRCKSRTKKETTSHQPDTLNTRNETNGELIPISIGEKTIQMRRKEIDAFCLAAMELGLLEDLEKRRNDPKTGRKMK